MLKSIRARIVFWQLLVTALIIAAFSLVLFSTVKRSLYQGVDLTLISKAQATMSGLDFQGGELNLQQEEGDFSTADLLLQISDFNGNILLRSVNLGQKRLPLDAALRSQALREGSTGLLKTVSIGGGPPLRLLTLVSLGESTSPALLVQVATSLRGVEGNLAHLRFWLLVIAPSLLLLSSLGSFFLAHHLLRPLQTMAHAAERIGERNLDQRLPVVNPHDEIGQLEGTFNRMFDRLQRAFENQRRFVSDASHELRTPLTVLRGKLEVALRKARSPGEYRQVLETALAQSERLSHLVERLLMLARADSGEWHPDLRPVHLDKLIAELCHEFYPLAEQKRISLGISCADDILIRGDAELLRHLILNLLDNAIKYTKEGGEVRLILAREGHQAKLTVSDTGVGISAEDLPHIFERFYRVDKARSQRVSGTGLGLSIVKEIVAAHQGSIRVESTPGQGTRFTVYLPLDETIAPAS